MIMEEVLFKLLTTCLELDDESGMWEIDPLYPSIVINEVCTLKELNKLGLTLTDVFNILSLEKERRNRTANKTNIVVNWLYDNIIKALEQGVESEENKQIMDYLAEKTKEAI